MLKELEIFHSFLRERSLKLTPQRKLLAQKAFAMHHHFTAEELFEWARRGHKRISRATVYRTLALLVDSNLLEALDFGKGYKYYEHILGHPHHDHIVCIKCGKITEFESPEIEQIQAKVSEKENFHPMFHTLKIYGLCETCNRANASRWRAICVGVRIAIVGGQG